MGIGDPDRMNGFPPPLPVGRRGNQTKNIGLFVRISTFIITFVIQYYYINLLFCIYGKNESPFS
jgi:hypothetical protein